MDSLPTLRDYLAAERTLLAWVRTGIALMGFGFVVARFGLFLREIAAVRSPSADHAGLSLWFGTLLIATGVLLSFLSAREYLASIRRLDACRPPLRQFSLLAVGTSLCLAAIGIALAIYLVATGS